MSHPDVGRIENPTWRLRNRRDAPIVSAEPVADRPWIPSLPALGLLNVGSHKPKLRLADYYDASTAPPPPLAIARPHPGFGWGMLLNNQLGDCVCAMILHAIESWDLDVNIVPYLFQDADAQLLYEVIGGYVPGDPSTDGGCDEGTAMAKWLAGLPTTSDNVSHKALVTAAVNPTNLDEVRRAIDEFDGVCDGIGLPVTAQGQTEWTVVGNPNSDPNSEPGSWGGHATYTREYDPDTFGVLTWGTEILETVPFREAYHSQAFVVVPEDAEKAGVGPSGVQWDQLLADARNAPQGAAEAAAEAKAEETAAKAAEHKKSSGRRGGRAKADKADAGETESAGTENNQGDGDAASNEEGES